MTWQTHGLIQRFDGEFPEPDDSELAAYGWDDHRTRMKPINHGTEGGFASHRRRDEAPCDRCRAAANAAKKRRAINRLYETNNESDAA